MRRIEVNRVDDLPAGSLAKYISKGLPVLVNSEPALHKAVSTWNLDYLAAKHPNHPCRVDYYREGNRKILQKQIHMNFSDYVDIQKNDPKKRLEYYLSDQELTELFPHTADDVRVPDMIKDYKLNCVHIFTGVDTYTTSHYHLVGHEVILGQIVGKKRVRLYPPSQFRLLYPEPWYSMRYRFSTIPFRGTEDEQLFSRYPRLREAAVYDLMIEPGNALFIPQGWTHTVEGIGETISAVYSFMSSWRHAYWPLVIREHMAEAWQERLLKPLVRRCRRSTLTQGLSERLAEIFDLDDAADF